MCSQQPPNPGRPLPSAYAFVRRHLRHDTTLLHVGSADGADTAWLKTHCPHGAAVCVTPVANASSARVAYGAAVGFVAASATTLPFADGAFDAALLTTPDVSACVLAECTRVVHAGGLVAVTQPLHAGVTVAAPEAQATRLLGNVPRAQPDSLLGIARRVGLVDAHASASAGCFTGSDARAVLQVCCGLRPPCTGHDSETEGMQSLGEIAGLDDVVVVLPFAELVAWKPLNKA